MSGDTVGARNAWLRDAVAAAQPCGGEGAVAPRAFAGVPGLGAYLTGREAVPEGGLTPAGAVALVKRGDVAVCRAERDAGGPDSRGAGTCRLILHSLRRWDTAARRWRYAVCCGGCAPAILPQLAVRAVPTGGGGGSPPEEFDVRDLRAGEHVQCVVVHTHTPEAATDARTTPAGAAPAGPGGSDPAPSSVAELRGRLDALLSAAAPGEGPRPPPAQPAAASPPAHPHPHIVVSFGRAALPPDAHQHGLRLGPCAPDGAMPARHAADSDTDSDAEEAACARGGCAAQHACWWITADPFQPDAHPPYLALLRRDARFWNPAAVGDMAAALGVDVEAAAAAATAACDVDYVDLRRRQHTRYSREAVALGVQRSRAGDYAGAMDHYDTALRYDEGNADAYVGRGAARANRQQFAAAAEEFRRALRMDPGHANAAKYLQAVEQKMAQGGGERPQAPPPPPPGPPLPPGPRPDAGHVSGAKRVREAEPAADKRDGPRVHPRALAYIASTQRKQARLQAQQMGGRTNADRPLLLEPVVAVDREAMLRYLDDDSGNESSSSSTSSSSTSSGKKRKKKKKRKKEKKRRKKDKKDKKK